MLTTLSNVLGMNHKISQITPEMLQNLRDACYYRFVICQERNGAHFEHLLNNCKSFYNRRENTINNSIIPSNFIASLLLQYRLKEGQTSGKLTIPPYLW
jgi:hypothetical protein